MIQFAHTNIITNDWKKLADFYIQVFGCIPLFPERDLKGEWLEKATNIADAHIRGVHLALPGYDNKLPTLEIFQYEENGENLPSTANRKGFGHIAFKVSNVQELAHKIIAHGGSLLGEIVETDVPNAGHLTFAYAKDPDGNIIEIQNWR